MIDINFSDELVKSAATLALALLKKLPSVYMEDHLIRVLVTDVRINLVRSHIGSWCVIVLMSTVC